MKKKCGSCKKSKPIPEFNRRASSPDGRSYVCRACNRTRSKKYYSENREKHIRVTTRRKKKDIARNQELVFRYLLAHPCADCGEKDPLVLEFDHLRDKDRELSTAVHNGWSVRRLTQEIDKCEVRCSNCHKRKTALEQDNYKVKILRGSQT